MAAIMPPNPPRLIRLYIKNVAIGFVLSAVFVAILMYFNVANLWKLVTNSDIGWIAILMLWAFHGIVFAGVQFAISIMRMQDDDDDEFGGNASQRVTELIPIPVEK